MYSWSKYMGYDCPINKESNMEAVGIKREVYRGAWMSTHTGGRFYPLTPKPEDIQIGDIASALSKQTRFNGHINEFYSVAQHSVLASHLVTTKVDRVRVQMQALLHDASEAYTGDMVKPLKIYDEFFQDIEDRVWKAISEKFNIPFEMYREVKDIDSLLVTAEKRDLFPQAEEWDYQPDVRHIPTIEPWSWRKAEKEFMKRYRQLKREIGNV